MTTMVPAAQAWVICLAVFVVATGLLWLEWRRKDRRFVRLRLAATVTASLALVLFGVRPAWRHANGPGASGVDAAVVWTKRRTAPEPPSVKHLVAGFPLDRRFVLPGASVSSGEQATNIPDLAYLRRHHPELRSITLVGEGLPPSALDPLEGCRVTFVPLNSPLGSPAVGFMNCAREIAVGSPLVVQGRIDGVSAGKPVIVSLEAPDGSVTDAAIGKGSVDVEATFEVRGPPLPAPGKFVWKLRIAVPPEREKVIAEEVFGVVVTEVPPPRVLVLESSRIPTRPSSAGGWSGSAAC